jgi:hypothetical protein
MKKRNVTEKVDGPVMDEHPNEPVAEGVREHQAHQPKAKQRSMPRIPGELLVLIAIVSTLFGLLFYYLKEESPSTVSVACCVCARGLPEAT